MSRLSRLTFLGWLAIELALTGCGSEAAAPRLRITNRGSTPIANLTVLFPDGEVWFGNMGAG